MTASRGGRLGSGGMEQKGLMGMDNSVVIAGGERCKGTKWQWKKYIPYFSDYKTHFFLPNLGGKWGCIL